MKKQVIRIGVTKDLRKRIEQLEDAIDLVIEELAARGQGKEKVGKETLLEFLQRTLKAK